MSPATLCPPKCSDSVPLTPKWATAASESVPSSNSESRPPRPGFLPSLHLVATLGVRAGGGSPQVRAFPLHLPLPRPLGLVLKDSSPPPLPNSGQGHGGREPPQLEGKGLLAPGPPSKGGFQARWDGAVLAGPGSGVSGLGSVRLFSFAVGRGGGDEHWAWGGGEKWLRGRRKRPLRWSPVTGAVRTKKHSVHKIQSVPTPSPASLAPSPSLQAPEEVWGLQL